MVSEAIVYKLFKFMLVGIGGTTIDFGITYLLKEKVKINKYIANSIGYLSAATSNYVFTRIWVFESTNPNLSKQYLIFVTISLIGLGLMNLFIWLYHEKFKMNFYIAKVIALIIVLVWTFSAHYTITFS
ncbi:MAG: glycosyl transferase family 2 [Flavobacteriales bacterium CG_4_9_14_3_um_filter_40_17]|nr:MAG: glycosyl transferase family 2 [Flavobacteriales bacterium CG_4_9_14_3_um_filter_40_17]